MNFFRKSVVRKLFVHVVFFGLLITAIFLYFEKSQQVITLNLMLILLVAFAILFFLIYYIDVIKPMRTVLVEMQSLISAKPYKRIYTKRIDEIGILAYFFNQVTKSLGEISFDIKDRRRMISELDIAAQLQKDILPTADHSDLVGLSIIAKNRPASELGGDIFDFFSVKDKTYIYIGDVTGHGVAAGLIMTMASSLISVFSDLYDNPYDILVNVNKYIKKHVKKAMFLTMVMMCWDQKKQKLSYVGAGHEHILVYRAATGVCDDLMSGGVALGMVPNNSKVIKEVDLDLADSDLVILYSDGITEAKNVSGELFGLSRLKDLVVEYAAEYDLDGVHYHIAKDVSDYMEGHGQDDDITLIVMKREISK